MKNRIIALILVCVMSFIALASCDTNKFNFAENSDEYVTVNLEEFKKAIQAIEIEDADFTTNEETRKEKVMYNILASLTSAAVKNNDKLTTGAVDKNDVLYFVYYCTYTDTENDNKEYLFYGDQMNTTSITTTTTKANHVIELATVLNNEDAKFANAFYEALIGKFDDNGELNLDDVAYSAVTTTGTEVKKGDKIIVSYTRKPILAEDASDEDKKNAKTEKVLYMELILDNDDNKYAEGTIEAELVELFLGENMTTQVGKDIYRTDTTPATDTEEEKKSVVKEFNLTVDDINYTYSEIGVEWKVEKDNGSLFTFNYTPYETSQKLENNLLHATDEDKLDIKGKELTYHFYPVSYVEVSDITAESIIKEIFGSNIATTSIELFESEEYKNGDDTLKSLVETLAKLWKEDAETIKNFKNADETKTLSELAVEITKAESALDTAEDNLKKANSADEGYDALVKAVEDAEAALEAAETAYDDALDQSIDKQIAKILDSKKGEEALREIFVSEYESDVYDTLKTAYDSAIIDAVGDALWLLVEKYVVVNSYPDALVEEFYNHIYEQHEYDFYNGSYTTSSSSTSTESNYSHYKGDLEAYLADATDATNGDYEAAITDSAKEYIKPMLQVFALSAAIEGDSSIDITAVMKQYTETDKAEGAYEIYSHEGHSHDEDDTAAEEKQMQEAYENALNDAEHFLVDDDALKAYKKYIGKPSYNAYIDNYGEHNLRAALQLNRLMYYLLSTNAEKYDEEGTKIVKYVEAEDGSEVLDFRTVKYVFKADDAEEGEDAE